MMTSSRRSCTDRRAKPAEPRRCVHCGAPESAGVTPCSGYTREHAWTEGSVERPAGEEDADALIARIRDAAQLGRGHGHWDPSGQSGANCWFCDQQRLGRDRLDAALDELRARLTSRGATESGGEVGRLREALRWCPEAAWEGSSIEGYDFQDMMIAAGLMVEVPADEDFRAEWDTDTMYTLAWSDLGRAALDGRATEEGGQ